MARGASILGVLAMSPALSHALRTSGGIALTLSYFFPLTTISRKVALMCAPVTPMSRCSTDRISSPPDFLRVSSATSYSLRTSGGIASTLSYSLPLKTIFRLTAQGMARRTGGARGWGLPFPTILNPRPLDARPASPRGPHAPRRHPHLRPHPRDADRKNRRRGRHPPHQRARALARSAPARRAAHGGARRPPRRGGRPRQRADGQGAAGDGRRHHAAPGDGLEGGARGEDPHRLSHRPRLRRGARRGGPEDGLRGALPPGRSRPEPRRHRRIRRAARHQPRLPRRPAH